MNERIMLIRKNSGLTQEEFGKRIGGLSRNYIWMLEKGDRVPSDMVILSICREFRVNEQWLKTGEGSPYIEMTRKQEVESFLGDTLKDDESFRFRLISFLADLTDEQMEHLEELTKILLDHMKESDPGQ